MLRFFSKWGVRPKMFEDHCYKGPTLLDHEGLHMRNANNALLCQNAGSYSELRMNSTFVQPC